MGQRMKDRLVLSKGKIKACGLCLTKPLLSTYIMFPASKKGLQDHPGKMACMYDVVCIHRGGPCMERTTQRQTFVTLSVPPGDG